MILGKGGYLRSRNMGGICEALGWEKFSCPGCESLFDFHQNNLLVAFQDGGWVGRLFLNEG
jgi:hypothetical protein